jgi:hypothetical protein
MSDFFDGKIVNKSDDSYKIIDKELNYVVFTDLLAGTYEFELQIIDKNGTIYNTSSITINTEGNVPYSPNPDFDALITYNEDDDTYNFYYYPKYDHLNNKIETTYVLQDKDGNELDGYFKRWLVMNINNGRFSAFRNLPKSINYYYLDESFDKSEIKVEKKKETIDLDEMVIW